MIKRDRFDTESKNHFSSLNNICRVIQGKMTNIAKQ